MQIIFEDSEIVVCVKPIGVLSENSNSENTFGMPQLLEKECLSKIYPVHRLDKNVGGLMVFAKNSKAAANLSRQIAERTFEKQYYALLCGKLESPGGELVDLLFKDRRTNKTYVAKKLRKGVKEARLVYQTVAEQSIDGKAYTAVKVKLLTGRSHQIRVQFASRKHPLAGDRRYGAGGNEKNIELWSFLLSFNHPQSGKRMKFSVNPCKELLLNKIIP